MFRTGKTGGFTLIEMSMVLVIGGLLLASFSDGYRIYLANKEYTDTNDRLQTINSIIALKYKGAYLCPAEPHPVLPANLGVPVANCAGTPVNTCTPGGLCSVPGRPLPDGTPTVVLIGTVPFAAFTDQKTYNLKQGTSDFVLRNAGSMRLLSDITQSQVMFDAWGRQILYAVSGQLTNYLTYSDNSGAIDVTTENPSPKGLVSPAGSAHYVLVSAGADGLGAYDKNGNLVAPCPAPLTGGVDNNQGYNCNDRTQLPAATKATFVAGLLNLNKAGGTTYFDDLVYFRSMGMTSLWSPRPRVQWATGQTYTPGFIVYNDNGDANMDNDYYVATAGHVSDPTTQPPGTAPGANWATVWKNLPAPPADIYNATGGSVGLGTTAPLATLDVNNANTWGGIWVADTGSGLGEGFSKLICDQNNANCFPPDAVGGTGFSCQTGYALAGVFGIRDTGVPGSYISDSSVCQPLPPAFSTPYPFDCSLLSPPEVMTGIDGTGHVICGPLQ